MSKVKAWGIDACYVGVNSCYVYELAYPDGTTFYVGKGSYDGCVGRIASHLYAARGRYSQHEVYCIIRNIWAQGGIPIVRKVKERMLEEDALKLEMQLILYYGYDNLANKPVKSIFTERKKLRELAS